MTIMTKLSIATLAGAATIFVWGGASHMVLLKGIGFSRMSNEDQILSTLRTSLTHEGLYFFPSIDLRGQPSAEERAAWEARFRAGPTGMIIYHPAGDTPVSLKKLSVQFLSDVVASGIVAYVLFLSLATYWRHIVHREQLETSELSSTLAGRSRCARLDVGEREKWNVASDARQ